MTEHGGHVQLLPAGDCWRYRGAADSAVDLNRFLLWTWPRTRPKSTCQERSSNGRWRSIRRQHSGVPRSADRSSSARARVSSTRGFRALYVDRRRRLRGGRRGRELDRARGGADQPSRPSTGVQRDRSGPRFAVTSDCRGRSTCVSEKGPRSRSHMAAGAPFFSAASAGMRRACRAGRKPDWCRFTQTAEFRKSANCGKI